MTELRFETVDVGNLRVHVCSTDKFKTHMMVAMVQQELSPETVTLHALLPSVLQRGTRSYPSTVQLKRKLDELYGANMFGDVFKRGERHILQMGLELPDAAYLSEADALLDDGAAFLGELLHQPVTEGEAFRESYVKAEKKNLRQKIESLMDDKIRFAAHRCVEEMCEGEPYALFNHGRLQDLDAIDPQNLYTYYQELLSSRPIDLYFVGNLDTDRAVRLVENHFPSGNGARREISPAAVREGAGEVREVVDRLDVNQGKLNMGCRTGVTLADDDYPALQMYNGILGGFPHSKLFINVREKASLAYYAASRLESHKGILTVQSGIEIDNYQKAVDIIREQFDLMERGEFTDAEVNQTRAMLTNQLKERQDRAHDLVDSHYHGMLSGRKRPLDQMIDEVQRVTADQVKAVAGKVRLDTIYFLRDKGGVGNEKA
ncbi:EF-P 5-aminopentanol modification-associated protein YfmF [Melghirimyces profundicolus]|uniref:EF-P 5-aminopentanol modification-associated protein YfmF n=1 Tax=Melghirimyces profundicolus TaxID=1242148 RepID=UPI000D37208B|nr:pitrilysin family protein [Melghirimyces profundicolus]